MTRLLPLPTLALALLAAGCGQPAGRSGAATAPHDERTAQVAREQAAEADVATQVTLARLTKEVADLHVEIDELKAGKDALSNQLLAARVQALEVRLAAVPAADPAAAAPTPDAPAARSAPKPLRHQKKAPGRT